MNKTSQQWWNETVADLSKLEGWLQRQCYGELKAHERILALSKKFNNNFILEKIAGDELKHHLWLKEYLISNGIPLLSEHEERYWKEINMDFKTIEEMAAVGHHAEMMRLERIRVIAQDESLPFLSNMFKYILLDEEFHAEAFKKLSNEQQIELAKVDHAQGMLALGLEA